MKKLHTSLVAVVVAGALGGCVATVGPDGTFFVRPLEPVVVAQPMYVQPRVVQPAYVQQAPAVAEAPADVESELDYTGWTTPIQIAGYVDPFYPRYMSECLCIWYIGYYNGGYINHLGAPITWRNWGHPPRNVIYAHQRYLRENPHAFPRLHSGTRPGGSTARPGQQHVVPQQHVQPQVRQQHRLGGAGVGGSRGTVHQRQQQVRPQQRAPIRAPAPAKKTN